MKPELITIPEAKEIISSNKPRIGLFYCNSEDAWTAIDNSTNDLFVEVFDSLEEAIAWLN